MGRPKKVQVVKLLEITRCEECYHFEEYGAGYTRCREAEKWILTADIPKWCPLETKV